MNVSWKSVECCQCNGKNVCSKARLKTGPLTVPIFVINLREVVGHFRLYSGSVAGIVALPLCEHGHLSVTGTPVVRSSSRFEISNIIVDVVVVAERCFFRQY